MQSPFFFPTVPFFIFLFYILPVFVIFDITHIERIDKRIVLYKDALYCAAQENCYDENGNWFTRPYFVKLELVENK